MQSTQKEVYDCAAKPIIDSVIEGFNGTIFAYGQTSSGKTHTMQGPNIEDIELQGIIPRMVRTVFNRIETASEAIEFSVKVSMVEIYMEKIKDLIDPSKENLRVHEDKQKGVYLQDVSERYIADENEVYELMKHGNSNRSIAATLMNAESSRSHSIFILTITQNNTEDLSCKTGKLYLVDLAGSEKISKTGAEGQTLEEAKTINKSLTTLGKVIKALTDKKINHIPYRESKLTRILSESLGGNSKTCLVITCSPSPFNTDETLSTLRFGARARSIKNNAKVNREYTIPELKKLLEKAEAQTELYRMKCLVLEEELEKLGGAVLDEKALEERAIEQKKKEEELQDLKEAEELARVEAEEAEKQLQRQLTMDKPPELDIDDEEEKTADTTVDLALLQEKQDQIDQLQDELQAEKEKLQESQKLVADFKEELAILEGQIEAVRNERDQLQLKQKQYIHKLQQA